MIHPNWFVPVPMLALRLRRELHCDREALPARLRAILFEYGSVEAWRQRQC